jgi:hypothetical protein
MSLVVNLGRLLAGAERPSPARFSANLDQASTIRLRVPWLRSSGGDDVLGDVGNE